MIINMNEKMETLQFTKKLLRISCILPQFNGFKLEALKVIILTLPSFYELISTSAFIATHPDNLLLVAMTLYVTCGALIALSLNVAFSFKTKDVMCLLDEIEKLVNNRK